MTKRTIVMLALGLGAGCSTDHKVTGSGTASGGTDATDSETGSGGSTGGGSTTAATGGTTTGGGTAGGTTTGGSTGGSTGADLPPAGCDGDEGQVIYVHFGGGTFVGTSDYTDDPTTNHSWILGSYSGPGEIELEPYGGTDTQEILEIMGTHWEPFDVCLTDERPATGDYTMLVVTPTNFAGVPGVSPVDCGNEIPALVAFTFTDAMSPSGTAAVAIGSSGNLGPTFGLENQVDDMEDIMCKGAPCDDYSQPRTFKDSCIPLASGSGTCLHAASCSGEQNSHQELLTTLGPAK